MLQNPYLLAKIGADTAENERNVAKILCQKSKTTLRVHAASGTSAPASSGRPRVTRERVLSVVHRLATRMVASQAASS